MGSAYPPNAASLAVDERVRLFGRKLRQFPPPSVIFRLRRHRLESVPAHKRRSDPATQQEQSPTLGRSWAASPNQMASSCKPDPARRCSAPGIPMPSPMVQPRRSGDHRRRCFKTCPKLSSNWSVAGYQTLGSGARQPFANHAALEKLSSA